MMVKKDIVIIGGGPAGLTAAIYAKRADKGLILLEPNLPGGQITWSSLIENYPGFKSGVRGLELARLMEEQALRTGVEISPSRALEIVAGAQSHLIKTEKNNYEAQAVIIAAGAVPKKLGVAGEKEFLSKGVSYCAACDAPLFKNKTAVVVGGGDVALEEALYLGAIASKVYLIHRRQGFRAAAVLEERVRADQRIELMPNCVLEAIEGDNLVRQVKLKNTKNNASIVVKTDGVFIFIGSAPNSDIAINFLETDKNKFIITDEAMATNVKGIYAAGDVRAKEYRQVVLACADGAVAGLSAARYLNENGH